LKGLPLPKAYQILSSKVDGLPEKDRDLILAKLEGGEPFNSLQEKNTLLMMLLRAHCEAKQAQHSHRLPE
jgi:TBC1 domain-containing protein 4